MPAYMYIAAVWLVCYCTTIKAYTYSNTKSNDDTGSHTHHHFSTSSTVAEMESIHLTNYDVTVLLPATIKLQGHGFNVETSSPSPAEGTFGLSAIRHGDYKHQQMEEICGLFYITLREQRANRRAEGPRGGLYDHEEGLVIQIGSQLGVLALALRKCMDVYDWKHPEDSDHIDDDDDDDDDIVVDNGTGAGDTNSTDPNSSIGQSTNYHAKYKKMHKKKNTIIVFERNEVSFQYTMTNLLLNPPPPIPLLRPAGADTLLSANQRQQHRRYRYHQHHEIIVENIDLEERPAERIPESSEESLVADGPDNIQRKGEKVIRNSDFVDTTLLYMGVRRDVSEAKARVPSQSLLSYLRQHYPVAPTAQQHYSTICNKDNDTSVKGAVAVADFICPMLILVDLSVNISYFLHSTLYELESNGCHPIVYFDTDCNSIYDRTIPLPRANISDRVDRQDRNVIAAAVIERYKHTIATSRLDYSNMDLVQHKLLWHYPIHEMVLQPNDPATTFHGASVVGTIRNNYQTHITSMSIGANIIIYPFTLPVSLITSAPPSNATEGKSSSSSVIANIALHIRVLSNMMVFMPHINGDREATKRAIDANKSIYYDILPLHPSMAVMLLPPSEVLLRRHKEFRKEQQVDQIGENDNSVGAGLLRYLRAHPDDNDDNDDTAPTVDSSIRSWDHSSHYRFLPSYEANLYSSNHHLKVRRVVDCFTFYNELEMLYFRLTELWHVIDYFVLVEATLTHSGQPKPLYYEQNKHLFSKFHDKIIHVVVDDMPLTSTPATDNCARDANGDDADIAGPRADNVAQVQSSSNRCISHNNNSNNNNRHTNVSYAAANPDHFYTWMIEGHQRNAIANGLMRIKGWNDDDLIIVSDVDELPSASFVGAFAVTREKDMEIGMMIKLSQEFYYYNLNTRVIKSKVGTAADPNISGIAIEEENQAGMGVDGETRQRPQQQQQQSDHELQWWEMAYIINWGSYVTDAAVYPEVLQKHRMNMQIGLPVIRTGWHFSYFASPAGIINKLQNFAHQEYNREQYKNASRIQELIDQKKDIFGRANTLLEHVEVEAIEHLPDNFQMLIELFNK